MFLVSRKMLGNVPVTEELSLHVVSSALPMCGETGPHHPPAPRAVGIEPLTVLIIIIIIIITVFINIIMVIFIIESASPSS